MPTPVNHWQSWGEGRHARTPCSVDDQRSRFQSCEPTQMFEEAQRSYWASTDDPRSKLWVHVNSTVLSKINPQQTNRGNHSSVERREEKHFPVNICLLFRENTVVYSQRIRFRGKIKIKLSFNCLHWMNNFTDLNQFDNRNVINASSSDSQQQH